MRIASFIVAASCVVGTFASTQTWNYDLTTTGNNVNFTSPTATDPSAPRFNTVSAVNLVEVRVRYLVFNLGPFNVTDQLPPEVLSNAALLDGPAPITIINEPVVVPPPPEAVTFAGTINLAINAAGFGTASVTNVTLGTAQINLGPPFGTQTVTITSIRVRGSIEVTPIYDGDLDLDGDVDLTDLATLLTNFGLASGATEAQGDVDGDGGVSLTDLALLLTNFGRN